MAKISTDLKERPLHDLVEGLFREQKHDIYLHTRGHLNADHLLKPPEKASHTPWESSDKEIPTLLKPSKLPSPPKTNQGEKQLLDAMCNFSVGTSGSVFVPGKDRSGQKLMRSKRSSSRQSPVEGLKDGPVGPDLHPQRPNTQMEYIPDNAYVEELRLPELMLPLPSKQSPRRKSPRDEKRRGSGGSSGGLQTHQFVPSHLGGITKKDQYEQFKYFQDHVLRKGDVMEKKVLTGRKAVQHLEEKLFAELMKLDVTKRQGGPNFHKLQIYSNIWQDLNDDTPTFGKLLSDIKSEYDQYLGVLLDTQPHKHSELLGRQVQSLTSSGLVLPGELKMSQDLVQKYEAEAQSCLQENERLRQELKELRKKLADLPPEPENPPEARKPIKKEDDVQSLTDQVLELHADVLAKIDEIEKFRQELRSKYVPSSVCHHLEQNVRDTEADILKLLSTNEYLEKTIQHVENDVDKIFEKYDVSEPDIRQIWKSINTLSSGLPGPED
ncbi:hypothetical protein HOLleu_32844 [Holothuria leucospilota]|uniref:Translin-associated factor X-interacting protein 1 N-terminal domain-containing protein n=1 Tax=Holothuria leucospilota TaxID=206669 RepID=A0A9Q1GXQ3_HOLLE|nr:hypothetical protein HOLleu_32844 [Holothuria leucospilota]